MPRPRDSKRVVLARNAASNEAFPSKPRIDVVRERLNALKAEELCLRRSCVLWSPVHGDPLSFSTASSAAPLLRHKDRLFLDLFWPGAPSIPGYGRTSRPRRKLRSSVSHECGRRVSKATDQMHDCAHQKFPPLDGNAIEAHLRGRILSEPMPSVRTTRAFFSRRISMERDGRTTHRRIRGPARRRRHRASNVTLGRRWSRVDFFSEPVPLFSRADWAPFSSPRQRRRSPDAATRIRSLFPEPRYDACGGFGNLIALPLAKAPRERAIRFF